jgi:hypothetical protein
MQVAWTVTERKERPTMKKRWFLLSAFAVLLGVGLYAFAAYVPATHAAGHATVGRFSGATAIANFADTRGDVTIAVTVVVGSNMTPSGEPGVGLSVGEFNNQTGDMYYTAEGNAPAPTLQIDTKKLGSAFLPDTAVPVAPIDLKTGQPIGPTFIVQVSASWTGQGPISISAGTDHFRVPHLYNVTIHGSEQQRAATADGSFSYTSPLDGGSPLAGELITVSGATSDFAVIYSSRSMIVEVQH